MAQLHPELDFMLTWKNLGGSGLSPTALDFEFRAFHLILPLAEFLKKIRVMKSNKCVWCDNIDNYEHLFFDCDNVQ